MSTRSYIGIHYPASNEIKYIYCHNDGYIEHVGKILFNNYKTLYNVENLVDIGDISSLKETLDQTKKNTFNEPYHKATYEDNFFNQAFYDWIEYVYLFNASTKQWYVWSNAHQRRLKPYKLLKAVYDIRSLEGKLELAILSEDNKLLNKTASIALWEYVRKDYSDSKTFKTYKFQRDLPKNREQLKKIIDEEYNTFFKRKVDNNGQCNEQAEKYITIAWDAVHSLPLKTNNKPQ